jgi:uncharacterized protein YeeX (DUF496 family)
MHVPHWENTWTNMYVIPSDYNWNVIEKKKKVFLLHNHSKYLETDIIADIKCTIYNLKKEQQPSIHFK